MYVQNHTIKGIHQISCVYCTKNNTKKKKKRNGEICTRCCETFTAQCEILVVKTKPRNSETAQSETAQFEGLLYIQHSREQNFDR